MPGSGQISSGYGRQAKLPATRLRPVRQIQGRVGQITPPCRGPPGEQGLPRPTGSEQMLREKARTSFQVPETKCSFQFGYSIRTCPSEPPDEQAVADRLSRSIERHVPPIVR